MGQGQKAVDPGIASLVTELRQGGGRVQELRARLHMEQNIEKFCFDVPTLAGGFAHPPNCREPRRSGLEAAGEGIDNGLREVRLLAGFSQFGRRNDPAGGEAFSLLLLRARVKMAAETVLAAPFLVFLGAAQTEGVKMLTQARFSLRVNLGLGTPCAFPCHRLLNQYRGLIAQVRIEMRDGIAWALYYL